MSTTYIPANDRIPATLEDLQDVTITNVQDCQVLKFNQSADEWRNNAFDLGALTDTDFTTAPTSGQVLRYFPTQFAPFPDAWQPGNDVSPRTSPPRVL